MRACVCVCGNNGNHDNDTHGTLPMRARGSRCTLTEKVPRVELRRRKKKNTMFRCKHNCTRTIVFPNEFSQRNKNHNDDICQEKKM